MQCMGQKSIGLTRDAQKRAFENAADAVREDVDAARVTDGDVVRILAEAYTGTFETGAFDAYQG